LDREGVKALGFATHIVVALDCAGRLCDRPLRDIRCCHGIAHYTVQQGVSGLISESLPGNKTIRFNSKRGPDQ
jgi:hypothetical protein